MGRQQRLIEMTVKGKVRAARPLRSSPGAVVEAPFLRAHRHGPLPGPSSYTAPLLQPPPCTSRG